MCSVTAYQICNLPLFAYTLHLVLVLVNLNIIHRSSPMEIKLSSSILAESIILFFPLSKITIGFLPKVLAKSCVLYSRSYQSQEIVTPLMVMAAAQAIQHKCSPDSGVQWLPGKPRSCCIGWGSPPWSSSKLSKPSWTLIAVVVGGGGEWVLSWS